MAGLDLSKSFSFRRILFDRPFTTIAITSVSIIFVSGFLLHQSESLGCVPWLEESVDGWKVNFLGMNVNPNGQPIKSQAEAIFVAQMWNNTLPCKRSPSRLNDSFWLLINTMITIGKS